jgi:F-type H+-transporting ATPase subunit a
MKHLILIVAIAIAAICSPQQVVASTADNNGHDGAKINPKEIIFEHLGDGYGWEVPFCHDKRIPLPVIVRANDGSWHCFSSSRVADGAQYDDGGHIFAIAHGEAYNGKIVEIESDGNVYRPIDLSITKNVLALFITVLCVLWSCMSVANWYRKNGYKAPRRYVGIMEVIIEFVYNGVIKATLKADAKRFAPYLLTVFMFILFMNLLGLIVIFPGGANLTGNIAVTLVLALLTFLATNLFGTKHYWKEIFWPEVPMWLKAPIPIMPVIELFGVFTKPAALTVRLFANMMGGHMIVIVLTLLIFIFAQMGMAAAGATTVVSVGFSIFMLLIDVLVSFIQAFVFTMLSTLFISLAQARPHEHDESSENASVVPN